VTTALSALAVLAGALLASATGFGFQLLSAPLLFALLGPPRAVGALLVLGVVLNVLTLSSERRRPRPLRRESALMLAWAAPGTVAGVLVLRSVSALVLQLVLTAAVLATLVLRRRAVRRTPAWAAPLAGFSAGALTTATSASGPPLITYLLGRGHEPGEVRDTLTFCFIVLSVLGALALWITGTGEARPDSGQTAILVPAVVLGSLLGRRAFARLAAGGRYEGILTAILLAAVALGLITAIVD
jgi:uncharacterized membrane protein YfcA